MVFFYLDYFWLRFIIMKTLTDCKLQLRKASPVTPSAFPTIKKGNTLFARRRLLPHPRGYSHTLPIRVCAAQWGRDSEAPDLERGIVFRTHESPSFVSSHLKLLKDRLLLKLQFNASTSKLLYFGCTLCFSVQSGHILDRAASTNSSILDKQARRSLERVYNVPEGDGNGLKKGTGEERENR